MDTHAFKHQAQRAHGNTADAHQVHMARNALALQLLGRDGSAHIRAGDMDTHAFKHQAQRAHGNTADAHQVHMAFRLQKIGNRILLKHIRQFSRRLMFA